MNISVKTVESTHWVFTTVLPSSKNNQKEVKQIINNLLVKIPGKDSHSVYSAFKSCFLGKRKLTCGKARR